MSVAIDHADLFLYRDRTAAMLRRYLHLSVQLGRLPSLLGREFFRARVSSYRMTTLEDAVIFVHDMDRCLERVDPFSRKVLARVVLQEYPHAEAARLLSVGLRTLQRRLPEALDALSAVLLERELLRPIDGTEPSVPRKGPQREGCSLGQPRPGAVNAALRKGSQREGCHLEQPMLATTDGVHRKGPQREACQGAEIAPARATACCAGK